jgi:histone-lysine N-methyltransferase SUV39H
LVSFYREQRHPIYECNPNCACGPGCKSRVVQKGRKVPLTIFKTPNRGWGVRCDEELIQGEFVDTYIGEIITNEEAGRREKTGSVDKQSYLYSLDKWINDEYPDLTEDTCYVVDGQYMGGPTRFINHSCEPNCRQYTVSYDKNNPRVYDIAFFAVTNIPAGTELTFDYQDLDEVEEDVAVATREAKLRDPANARKQ